MTITGLKPGGVVNAKDLNSKDNGKRFSAVSELDDSGTSSSLKVNNDGKIKFRVNFNDDKPSTDGADYEALMKLGTASVYVTWAVEVLKEESEPEPEPEPKPKPVVAEKEVKKQEELERVKARSESIDFKVIGVATQSTLANEVEGGSSEVELVDASEFETEGTATITDADGSETFTWRGKQEDQLTGVAGITRTFVAASIVVSKDDLQVIKGIGPFIEEKLNALGIYTYRQIANMTFELEDQVNEAIEFFPGRVKRDQWVAQAKILIGEEAELDEKALKKAEDLDRVAAKAEGIDFGVLGIASASDKDDLQVIKGIGPFIEEKLNALGIFKFSQIAKMTSEIEEEVNVAIEFFPGRVKRDEWVKQAKELTK
jgi:predicted flap endonuclease-1-like 5' DNA nuclease